MRKRGSILLAMLFVIVLSMVSVSFFFSLGGRVTLVTNQLKRAQALNCAEAALYDVMTRIRIHEVTLPAAGGSTIVNVSVPMPDATNPGSDRNVPVAVKITASSGTAVPYTLDAEVDYGNIRM